MDRHCVGQSFILTVYVQLQTHPGQWLVKFCLMCGMYIFGSIVKFILSIIFSGVNYLNFYGTVANYMDNLLRDRSPAASSRTSTNNPVLRNKEEAGERHMREVAASGTYRLTQHRLRTKSSTLTGPQSARPYVIGNHFPVKTGSKATRCWVCTRNKTPTRTVYKCEECDVNLCIVGCFKTYHKP